jgi:MFS family permease
LETAAGRTQKLGHLLRHAGISYNIARSFGPAIGGVIVALAGSIAAFAANALLYLPLIVVLLLRRRVKEVSRLPPERMARAVISGVRYILHSPSIRIVLARTLATGVAGGSVSALMPIVTRDLLHGGAQTYGLMLGTFGMGAVIGALNVSTLRNRLGDENSIRMCASLTCGIVGEPSRRRFPGRCAVNRRHRWDARRRRRRRPRARRSR